LSGLGLRAGSSEICPISPNLRAPDLSLESGRRVRKRDELFFCRGGVIF
jgi:hypothetical protein